MDFKLPTRQENSNKGTFGKVLNISGSEYMWGAAYLSSVSALTVGAGFVALASEECVLKRITAPEIVLCPLSKISEIDATVLLIGCGLSTSDIAKKLFKQVIPSKLPTVIDADGVNILAELYPSPQSWEKVSEQPKAGGRMRGIVLTPHPKEASRLLNCSLDEILADMEGSAQKICTNITV